MKKVKWEKNGDKCVQTFKNTGPIIDSYLPPMTPKMLLVLGDQKLLPGTVSQVCLWQTSQLYPGTVPAPPVVTPGCVWNPMCLRGPWTCLLLVVTSGQAAADPQQRVVIWDGIQSRKQEEASKGPEMLTVRWRFVVATCRRKSCHLGKSPHLFHAGKPGNHSFSRVYLNFNTWLILYFIMKTVMLCKVLK